MTYGGWGYTGGRTGAGVGRGVEQYIYYPSLQFLISKSPLPTHKALNHMELKRMTREDYPFLFELLKEKTPEQNISFVMPTWEEHVAFNDKHLDAPEYVIWEDGERAGRVYMTSRREIGIHVAKKFRGRGLAKQAIKYFMDTSGTGEYILANINPLNTPSIGLFESQGFKHIQNTYKWVPHSG